MRKIYQNVCFIILIIIISLINIAPAATAATYPYYFYWDFINVDIDVQTNGDMLITENQKYVFTKLGRNQRYRYIPLDQVDEITDVSVFENDKKIVSDTGIENNNFWIRWQHELNPPESHFFTLKYRVVGGLKIKNEKYEVYWKAIFRERNASIHKANIKVSFPEKLSGKIQMFKSYGAPTKAQQIDENTVEFVSNRNISPYQEIEVKVILYDEIIQEPIEVSAFTVFVITLLFLLIISFPLLLILFFYLYLTGENSGDSGGFSGGSVGDGGGDAAGGGGGD